MEATMSTKLARGRRIVALLASGGLLAGVMAIAMNAPAQAEASKPVAGLSAFVNGVELHAHAVAVPDPKLANVNEAFNVSAVNSAGLNSRLVSEVNDAIEPQAGKYAYARGGGVDVGVGSASPTNINGEALSLSIAESKAPTDKPPYVGCTPPNCPITNVQTIDLNGALNPVANASALGGRAAALWNPNFLFPTLGNPLTYAFGTAADAQLLNQGDLDPLGRFLQPILSTDAPPANAPDRNVASTQSFTYLVNNGDGTCGIAAEIHQTIAPVNINLLGTTIEVAGDWVMKAVATGKPTGNSLTYGPTAGGTHVLNAIDNASGTSLGQLNLQDIFTDTGLAEQLDALDPLLDAAVGADARAISPPNADGTATVPNDTSSPTVSPTHVAGAADVVRLKALSVLAPLDPADIRVGHFEMDLRVPDGGAECEIPVDKSAVDVAKTGENITFTVKIPSDPKAVEPFPCDLTNVTVNDVVSVDKADTPSKPPKLNILSATGPHGEVGTVATNKQSVNFTNIGAWKPGDPPLIITIKANIPSDSGTGRMKDVATATASAANCSGKKSVLGNVIGLITGDATGVGNGSVTGTGNFFGSSFTGLTANIRGGGNISVTGKDLFSNAVAAAQVLAVTGRNDTLYLALALFAFASAFGVHRLRRRVKASA
jgi:hypothetical protein